MKKINDSPKPILNKTLEDIISYINKHFEKIRSVKIDEETYAVGVDIARYLGYKNLNTAIKNHVNPENKTKASLTKDRNSRALIVINKTGVNELIFSTDTYNANKIKQWLYS